VTTIGVRRKSLAAENKDPVVHLDRGFWVVTAILALLSAVAVVAVIRWPVQDIPQLPEAVIPADQIDALFKFLTASAATIFIVVVGYLLYFSVAFRRRATDPPDAVGIQIHDNRRLEFWWTAIPTIFIVILGIFSVRIWYGIQVQPNNGLVLEAIGHQWWYDFRYPGVHGVITQEMHLPMGVPVTLHTTSTDVIHSFWMPAMRLKADMVPGLINTLRFTPTRAGRYKIICTEFCGTLHGEMQKQVIVIEPQAKFNTWLAGWQKKNAHASDEIPPALSAATPINLAGGDAGVGQKLFAQKCTACHAIGPFSQRVVGPGLRGVLNDPSHPKLVDGDAATPGAVAKILQSGFDGDMGHMPSATQNAITSKDIANLVAYLKTLK